MVEAKDIGAILNELVRRANETTRRLRALEERSSLLENRLSSVQDAILRNTDESRSFSEKLIEKFKSFETELIRIDNELLKLGKNLERTARKTELKELENMISIFNPVKTNFVTRDEVNRMIEERRR